MPSLTFVSLPRALLVDAMKNDDEALGLSGSPKRDDARRETMHAAAVELGNVHPAMTGNR